MKKRYWIFIVIVLVIGLIISIILLGRNDYYKSVYELNQNLDADGLRLMMSKDEIYEILGKEEHLDREFGTNRFEYLSKGLAFTIEIRNDNDLFEKICSVSISKPNYSIFGICVGNDLNMASQILCSRGYRESYSDERQISYTKSCTTINFLLSEKKIEIINIGVKDKYFKSAKIIY